MAADRTPARSTTDAGGPWTPDEEPALPARSVIASTLLGVRPPRLPTSLLVRSCGLFGIRPGTARVAISRMAAAGELEADGDGYALGPDLRARQDRQDLSRQGTTTPWEASRDGWHAAVVTGEARPAADRAALRRAARALRLAEVREGVWVRPANVDLDAQPEALGIVDGQCLRMRAHPDGEQAALAAGLWDLAAWSARAWRLIDALRASRPGLDAGRRDALPADFVLSAAALRHLQSDPLLPSSLLPVDWPGDDLRAAWRSWNRSFGAVWSDWYRAAQATVPD
ncbi:PaaX family transcriptional regulator C-terminal domain-containing protein [soil metagenome]